MKIKNILIGLSILLMVLPAAIAGTVTRSVSDSTPQSGDTVTVTLTIDAVSGDKAITIHEEAPFNIVGLSTNVYETALIDQIQVSDTVKTYQIVAGSTGVKSFSGKYQVNAGGDIVIGGVSSIDVGGVCTPGTWTPSPSTICAGTDFQQSDGCDIRTVEGTKTGGTCTDCGDGTCDSVAGETCTTCSTDCTVGCDSNGGGSETDVCSSNQDCEFWEKCQSGDCKVNTGMIVLVFIALFMVKALTG